MTSCGFTRATVRNQGRLGIRSAFAWIQCAAFGAMIGSNATPVPAHPMK